MTLEVLEARSLPALLPTGVDLGALSGGNGFVLDGPSKGAALGRTVAGIGDINGDGRVDGAFGAAGGSSNGGQVIVMFGSSSNFPAALTPSEMNGTNGFVINGVASSNAGFSVAGAGDVNDDGIDDLIIGAPSGASASGQAYVVFGKSTGFAPSLDLSALSGGNGFVINGVASLNLAGWSVAGAGDVNGDGIDDLLVGAPYADASGMQCGQAYVVFGKSTGFAASFNLSALNGSNGFTLNGDASYDHAGFAVAGTGDINGDGIDDLIVGAPHNTNASPGSGRAYVIFGKSSGFAATLNLSALTGGNGFVINGVASGDQTGRAVAGAGDVNGDGIDDLILGAPYGGSTFSGEACVVFGKSTGFAASLDVSNLNGANGFTLNAEANNDKAGWSVDGTADVNGDAIDDLVVSARDAEGGGSNRGRAYVVFGKTTGFAASLPLSAVTGTIGFALNGPTDGARAGTAVAGLGDFNGDGLDDLLVGAPNASGGGSGRGEGYLVFGRTYHLIATGPDADSAPLVRALTTTGRQLFELLALPSSFTGGVRVAVGDVNGDGMPDIITGNGAGMAAHVQVFDGWTGKPLTTGFRPYGVGFLNGVYVAAANVVGDSRSEIIVSPGKGPRPVKVFDPFGNPLSSFFPYGTTFGGGIRVAAGDVMSGGFAEIVTARGSGASQVKTFTSAGTQLGPTITAFSVSGGNFVAVGDVDGDGQQEIVVGAEGLQPPRVRWFNPATGAQEGQLTAYTPNNFHGGVRVSVLPGLAGPSRAAILTAPGKGQAALIKRFDAPNPLTALDMFFAYDQDFTGGAFVAGG